MVLDDVKGDVMADRPELRSPQIRVLMDDGAVFEVQAYNPDLIRWDETSKLHSWDAASQATLWLTFVAWAALTREGQIPNMKWDEFKTRALDVNPMTEQGTVMDPTNPEAEPD